MFNRHPFVRAFAGACLSLPVSLLFGCSDDGTITSSGSAPVMATGNWQISASAGSAALLPSISGDFRTANGHITATAHAQTASACVSPKASFALAGTVDSKNAVTLTGPVAGGTLTITGTLAADGRSLTEAAYNVVGGTCALSARVTAQAQAFTPINGVYSGTFADPDGQLLNVSATLSQSPSADTSGNFTLSGAATLPSNPCFPTSVPISDTQVTGGTFTFTYATADNSVTATGVFSADASTLTVTNWVSSGTCGADHGTGSLSK